MTHHNVKRMHPLRMTPKYEQTRPAGCMTQLVVLPILLGRQVVVIPKHLIWALVNLNYLLPSSVRML